MNKDSKWNCKCPECRWDAYAGFSKIECSNKLCKNYKKPENDDEETKIIPRGSESYQYGTEYEGYDGSMPTDAVGNPGYQSPNTPDSMDYMDSVGSCSVDPKLSPVNTNFNKGIKIYGCFKIDDEMYYHTEIDKISSGYVTEKGSKNDPEIREAIQKFKRDIIIGFEKELVKEEIDRKLKEQAKNARFAEAYGSPDSRFDKSIEQVMSEAEVNQARYELTHGIVWKHNKTGRINCNKPNKSNIAKPRDYCNSFIIQQTAADFKILEEKMLKSLQAF